MVRATHLIRIQKQILEYAEDRGYSFLHSQFKVPSATVDLLYTIRESHRYRNYSGFEGNLRKLESYKLTGYTREKLNLDLQKILSRREVETLGSQKKISLDTSKDTFFSNDGVRYVYDHDSIHTAVAAYFDRTHPTYTKILIDEVLCSKSKWDSLWIVDKENAVLEECFVLAFERGYVPFPTVRSEEQNRKWFQTALQGVSTSITSGWFRQFANLNYFQLLEYGTKRVSDVFRYVNSSWHLQPYKGT